MFPDEPIDYYNLYGFDDSTVRSIKNTASEQLAARKMLTWNWTPEVLDVLTQFRRVEGIFISTDELRKALERQWGYAPQHLLRFQEELAGTYLELPDNGRILLGISQAGAREDFNPADTPTEEFFFSSYLDWGFKYHLRHDERIESGDCIEFDNVKTFIENYILLTILRLHPDRNQRFSIALNHIESNMFARIDGKLQMLLSEIGLREVPGCRDSLNWTFVSESGYASKYVTWNRNGDLSFGFQLASESRDIADTILSFLKEMGFHEMETTNY